MYISSLQSLLKELLEEINVKMNSNVKGIKKKVNRLNLKLENCDYFKLIISGFENSLMVFLCINYLSYCEISHCLLEETLDINILDNIQ